MMHQQEKTNNKQHKKKEFIISKQQEPQIQEEQQEPVNDKKRQYYETRKKKQRQAIEERLTAQIVQSYQAQGYEAKVKDVFGHKMTIEINHQDKNLTYKGNVNHKTKLITRGQLERSDGNIFNGTFENGIFPKEGIMKLADGITFEGNFVNGKLNGNGKMILPDGRIFEGNFVNGNITGKGRMIIPDGRILDGTFVNGKMTGNGKMILPNGGFWRGNFVDGKFNGNVTMVDAQDISYIGQCEDGVLVKYETIKYPNKDKIYIGEFDENLKGKWKKKGEDILHEGLFRDGQLHGLGKKTLPDGTTFEGDFVNGKLNGPAKIHYVDGRILKVSLVNGKTNGKGRMVFPDGRILDGNFVNGNMTGKGRMVFPDGRILDGNFVNGNMTGKGRMILPDGRIFEGNFVNGNMTGTVLYKSPNKHIIANIEYNDGMSVDFLDVTITTPEQKIVTIENAKQKDSSEVTVNMDGQKHLVDLKNNNKLADFLSLLSTNSKNVIHSTAISFNSLQDVGSRIQLHQEMLQKTPTPEASVAIFTTPKYQFVVLFEKNGNPVVYDSIKRNTETDQELKSLINSNRILYINDCTNDLTIKTKSGTDISIKPPEDMIQQYNVIQLYNKLNDSIEKSKKQHYTSISDPKQNSDNLLSTQKTPK